MSDYLAIAAASCVRVLRDHKVHVLTLAEREICAGAIDALTARVAQLEACLTDVKEQLEMREIRE